MKRLFEHRFRRTTVMFWLCIAFLVGIGLAHSGKLLGAGYAWLCLPAVLLTMRKRTLGTLLWIVLFGLSLGWWRGSMYMEKFADYQALFEQKITITATAMQDGVYNKYQQMTFDAHDVVVVDTGQHLTGKISLGGFGLNAVFAGDEVTTTGKLQSSLGSYQGRMSYGQLELVAHHNTIVNELRRRFTAGVQSALPEPLASFGLGLLIGQRNTLPADVALTLLMVGLTHIIAVSGYNLTIVLRSADRLTGKRSKRLGVLLSLALIGLFLLFAGTSASVVRAAIVSLLSIAASYYGRAFKPLLLIAFAAAITAFANPFYVWGDSSWYLSFLAFFGIMVLAPAIRECWHRKWEESLVLGIALESVCAELMTMPFILHVFGQVSFISLVANILVAVLVPLAMLLTMIAGLAGMLLAPIAGWLAWPAIIVLTYMLDATRLLSKIPHVFAQNLALSTTQMITLYCLLGAVTAILTKRTKAVKHATITDTKRKEQEIERSFQVVNNQT